MTNGSAILTFNSKENSRKALEKLNNFNLDAKHTLKAYNIQDFEEIMETSDTFLPP